MTDQKTAEQVMAESLHERSILAAEFCSELATQVVKDLRDNGIELVQVPAEADPNELYDHHWPYDGGELPEDQGPRSPRVEALPSEISMHCVPTSHMPFPVARWLAGALLAASRVGEVSDAG